MKTILLIEDNSEIRDNTTELLELEGFRVISAVNGAEGISKALSEHPDLILCDIMMPEVNGWEVIRQIKAHESRSHIPFIFISASVEKKEVKTGFDLGAQGYLRKPFESEELMKEISKHLGVGS